MGGQTRFVPGICPAGYDALCGTVSRALRSIHPMEIYRSGMDNPAKLPGWKKYVFPIYMAYNGKCRKDALPMKF